MLTIGERIAHARLPSGAEARADLLRMGVRLERQRNPQGELDPAFDILLVANNHRFILELFRDKPQWANGNHRVALRYLTGVMPWRRSGGVKFAASTHRATAIPASYLPEPEGSEPMPDVPL